MSSRSKDTKKNSSDIKAGSPEGKRSSLRLEHGTQYLCQARLDVAGQPGILQVLQGVPHLHLRVDVAIEPLAPEKGLYEVRLTLQGQGTIAGPEGQEPQTIYAASVVYGGLFGVEGSGSEEARKKLLSQEAPTALFHGARHTLLTLIRDAGFPVGAPQPIDFRTFWDQKKAAVARDQAALQEGR
ncbi:protein-export chaperone SecB [Oecophyllibacter saccharovorans]|uniref:Preprotein translocase subunit SecB n=1 Tax=Oecophyllibacter saccharovorans TaxID=2558360 RepID=A0A506UQL4_9PROT|nr:protein-export chaperone SecB [Oecophyllibacter saccharovorans]TPW34674.1 hypothetical protein E3203_03755 [Oecophyllibacter saccharovorans]TPW35616.1 hypothetical protein E3202_01185 [Oecophyllibacter saccharovorans]